MSQQNLYWHHVIGADFEALQQAEKECEKQFGDILNVERHVSRNHRPMRAEQRAAQFLPFSALSGYEEEIAEVSRLTQNRVTLSEEEMQNLNAALQELQKNGLSERVEITYFVPDEKKSGGSYQTYCGWIHQVDAIQRVIVTKEKNKIDLDAIVQIKRQSD